FSRCFTSTTFTSKGRSISTAPNSFAHAWRRLRPTTCPLRLPSNGLRISERFLDCANHLRRKRLNLGKKTGDHFAVPSDEKFFEIPGNIAAEFWVRLLRCQEPIQLCLT